VYGICRSYYIARAQDGGVIEVALAETADDHADLLIPLEPQTPELVCALRAT
jgi:hypothetical protein